MKTLINIVLDESGSMQTRKEDTINGFNTYVKDILEDDVGEAFFTFTKFNSHGVNIVHSNVPIADVRELDTTTYLPASLTPLYDAIGKTIEEIEDVALDYDQVLFVILTDGNENASTDYTKEDITSLIEGKETSDGWTFVYLGADQDAWGVGSSFGISSTGNTHSHRGDCYPEAFLSLSKSTHNHRVSADTYTANFFVDPNTTDTEEDKDGTGN